MLILGNYIIFGRSSTFRYS